MNDDQLRSFIAAIENGSFNKAAKGQYISVPSLVQRINTLEGDLGYRILERSPRGIRPTKAGNLLYDAAKQALDILDRAKAEGLAMTKVLPKERVTIGVWWQVSPFMAEAVRELSETHPGIQVDFVETSFADAAEGFEKGSFDIFFSTGSLELARMGVAFTPLAYESYYCTFSPNSPLTEHDTISTDLLEGITVYAGADYRDIPELGESYTFFARDNVVRESIFREKLMMDCLRGSAVSFINQANLSKVSPPLDARPMDWPKIAYGAHLRPNASDAANVVLTACVSNFKLLHKEKSPTALTARDSMQPDFVES